MDGSVAYAFEVDGTRYLSAFYALDSKSLGQEEGDEKVTPCWIHIASIGEYKGHPAGGFAFDDKAFDDIIRNFDERKTPLNVDYEHQTFNRALKGAIDSAGWIVKLERRGEDGEELWALTNLLPEAAERIRARQLRHCSPVVIPESTDKQTGDDIGFELRSLALTNDPFLDGLHPIKLTRVAAMADEAKMPEDDKSTADGGDKPNEEKKMADSADGGGSAADALMSAIADAAGADADTVLAVLSENKDMLVKAVQDAIEQGGTPAENSDKREMRAMSITVGPVNKMQDKTLKLMVDAAEGKIRKLTEQVAEQTKTIEAFVRAKAAAENAALEAKVRKLQEEGFVRKDDQAFKDAVKLYRDDPELAERIYSMQLPPSGLVADDNDPAHESGRDGSTKPLLMSQLTEGQRASYEALRGYGKSEKEALEFIAKKAAKAAEVN